jgi:hypothetical protein
MRDRLDDNRSADHIDGRGCLIGAADDATWWHANALPLQERLCFGLGQHAAVLRAGGGNERGNVGGSLRRP